MHTENRINFLGKDLNFSYDTGKVKVNNYSGVFIREVAEGKLPIKDGRILLQQHLKDNFLNVFSDEGIMVAYPGRDNITLERKLHNLNELFRDVEVKLVITLRDPVDYFYSLYVELYPDYFSQIKDLNTFEKCVEQLKCNKSHILFESLFYSEYIPKIKYIGQLTILFFEDVKSKNSEYYKSWAEVLDLDCLEFKTLFEAKHVNKKNYSSKGTNKVSSLKFIESYAIDLLKNNVMLFSFFKKSYVFLGFQKLLNKRFVLKTVHKKPEGSYRDKLNFILSGDSPYRDRLKNSEKN